VQGKTIRTYVNDELMAEYTESENAFRASDKQGRWLSSGTFALQGHDPGSVVFYRNLRVKPLADDLPTPGKPTDDPEFDAKILKLSNDNFPLLNLNIQMIGGMTDLTAEQASAHGRKFGYTCGLVFSGEIPSGFRKPPHAFVGMRVSGPGSLRTLTAKVASEFDYVVADPVPHSGGLVDIDDPNAQSYMDELVPRIEELAASKKVNIYGSATSLPSGLRSRYDALWTEARIDRVIRALKVGNVAVEINDRLKVPSAAIVKRAKDAGVKFTFGGGNTTPYDFGKLTYCITMIEECRLTSNDLWLPQAEGDR
jgi:hypothetical protein